MKRERRAFVIVLCVSLFFLFSIFFMDKFSGHECVGSNCEICEEISICKKNLNELGAVAAAVCVAALLLFPKILKQICGESIFCKEDSLITLKTKLSA